MSLNAKEVAGNGGGKRAEPLDPGAYPARLVSVVGLGLQEQRPYMGQPKDPANEISITYELLDEFMVDDDGNIDEDRPRWISEIIPFYNLEVERAKSTKRYMALDAECVHGGDWTQLLGEPCMVTVVQNPGKGKNVGKVYNNITDISAMRQRQAESSPPLVNEPFFFDPDEPDMEVWEKLPDFIKDRIKANLEFKGSALDKALKSDDTVSEDTSEEPDDDIDY